MRRSASSASAVDNNLPDAEFPGHLLLKPWCLHVARLGTGTLQPPRGCLRPGGWGEVGGKKGRLGKMWCRPLSSWIPQSLWRGWDDSPLHPGAASKVTPSSSFPKMKTKNHSLNSYCAPGILLSLLHRSSHLMPCLAHTMACPKALLLHGWWKGDAESLQRPCWGQI